MSETRQEMQPALFVAAEACCIYHRTDGFCHPRNREGCECWALADSVMKATGLSARAVSWIFANTQRIENFATADREQNR